MKERKELEKKLNEWILFKACAWNRKKVEDVFSIKKNKKSLFLCSRQSQRVQHHTTRHSLSSSQLSTVLAPLPALGFARVTCQTVWPAFFYRPGPDLDSISVPTWCQAACVNEREENRCTLLNTNTIPDGFLLRSRGERTRRRFAHTYVWFLTHAPKRKKKKPTRTQETNSTTVSLIQPVKPRGGFRLPLMLSCLRVV